MPIELKISARIAVQMKAGKTPKGRTAYRTIYIRNLKPGLSDAEVMQIVEGCRADFPYPEISKIRYQIIQDGIIWVDDENAQKMERRKLRAEKRAAREAKKAAKEKASAQMTLDFPEEAENSSSTITKVTNLDICPAISEPAEAEPLDVEVEYVTRQLVYPPEREKEYRAILTGLIEGAPDGSSVDLSYEEMVEAGIPADFLESSGIVQGGTLTVHVDYADKNGHLLRAIRAKEKELTDERKRAKQNKKKQAKQARKQNRRKK